MRKLINRPFLALAALLGELPGTSSGGCATRRGRDSSTLRGNFPNVAGQLGGARFQPSRGWEGSTTPLTELQTETNGKREGKLTRNGIRIIPPFPTPFKKGRRRWKSR